MAAAFGAIKYDSYLAGASGWFGLLFLAALLLAVEAFRFFAWRRATAPSV